MDVVCFTDPTRISHVFSSTIGEKLGAVGDFCLMKCTKSYQKPSRNSHESPLFVIFSCFFWDLLTTLLHRRDSVGRHFFASLFGLHTHYKGLQSPSFSAYFISQVMIEEGRSFYKSLHQLYKSLRQIDELMGETFLASLSTISASFLKNAKQ